MTRPLEGLSASTATGAYHPRSHEEETAFTGTGRGDDLRSRAVYSLPEAARILRVSEATLRHWVLGRESRLPSGGGGAAPLIIAAGKGGLERLSFFNLVEGHRLQVLRGVHRVPMPGIRAAVAWLKERHGAEVPLLHLETDGRRLFIRAKGYWISASEAGQTVLSEGVAPCEFRIESDEAGLPLRFYPFTRAPKGSAQPTAVVIDPEVAFGRPVLKDTRIPTALVAERHAAGEAPETLAIDYDLPLESVNEAIRYEQR